MEGRPAEGGLSMNNVMLVDQLKKEIAEERKKYGEMKKRLAREKSAMSKLGVKLAEMKKLVAKLKSQVREAELKDLKSMAEVFDSSEEDEEDAFVKDETPGLRSKKMKYVIQLS